MELFESEEIICRTCLSNASNEYTKLSHAIEQNLSVEECAPTILDCLYFCLHTESPTNINLPLYICKGCLSKLKSSYEFIKMAKRSENNLLSQLVLNENIETNLGAAESLEIEYFNGDEEFLLENEHTCDLQYNVDDKTSEISYDEIEDDEEEMKISVEKSSTCKINEQTYGSKELHLLPNQREACSLNEMREICYDEIDCDEELIEINVETSSIENVVLEAATNSPICQINIQTNDSKKLRLLPHQCEQCSFETNSSFNLRRHYAGKHKINPAAQQLKRKEPGYFELSEENLSLHSKISAKLHDCEVCKKVFKTEYLLNCHLNKHKGLNPYKCQICSYECRYLSNISRHYKIKHAIVPTAEMLKPSAVEQPTDKNIEFGCKKCKYLGATNDELNSHLSREHCSSTQTGIEVENSIPSEAKPYNPYIYMCSKCSKKFKMLHVLKTHELTCSTETISNGSYAHFVNKPFECTECSSRFAISEYLQTHRAVVHRARVHQCHICEKSFKLPSHLKNHVERHSSSRSHKCDQCARSYVSKSELNVHRRVHTGELPYSCNFCSQRFRNADRLAVHRNKFHLHAKFKCSHCTEEFESKAKLQLHRYKHTSMPYNCDVCLKEFDKRHHIRRHMASVHQTKITDEQLAAMFAKNMKRNNRYDVFKLNSLLKANSGVQSDEAMATTQS